MNSAAARSVGIVLGLLALTCIATFPSLQSLWIFWTTILDYEHGPVIALVAVGWMARIAWRQGLADAQFSRAGTVLLGLLLFAWIVTLRANVDIAHQLLWPLAIGAVLYATLGAAVARRFAAAIALLYFTVPVWDYALPVLQRTSIFFSEKILALLGVAAQVTEYQVAIPEGTFSIIEGCSGKHYLVVTLAIAWLAAAMNGVTGWRRILFMVISVLLSMITNWIRIVTIIYAGHVSNMQHYLIVTEHHTLGTLLFIPLLAAVLVVARCFSPRQAAGAPVPPMSVQESPVSGVLAWRMVTPALLLVTFGLVIWGQAAARPASLGGLPLGTGRWQGPLPARSSWTPLFAGADAAVRATYTSATGEPLELYANVYASQQDGHELIQYGNSLIHPSDWESIWSNSSQPLGAGRETLSSLEVKGPGGQRWLMAYLYRVGSGSYRTDILAKLAYGWHSLAGQTPAGVIAVATPCDPGNCDKASALVADFWEYMQPDLLAMVPAGVSATP